MNDKRASRITLLFILVAQGITAFAAPYVLPMGSSLPDIGVRLAVITGAAALGYAASKIVVAFLRSRDIPRR